MRQAEVKNGIRLTKSLPVNALRRCFAVGCHIASVLTGGAGELVMALVIADEVKILGRGRVHGSLQ